MKYNQDLNIENIIYLMFKILKGIYVDMLLVKYCYNVVEHMLITINLAYLCSKISLTLFTFFCILLLLLLLALLTLFLFLQRRVCVTEFLYIQILH